MKPSDIIAIGGWLLWIILFVLEIIGRRRLNQRFDDLSYAIYDENSQRLKAENERFEMSVKLEVAERTIIDLRRTVPGRDNTGRFTKKPACSEVNGSE